jgi:glyoxylase-like metal-dependent hydrolase (beta-lactamase superfamily II)
MPGNMPRDSENEDGDPGNSIVRIYSHTVPKPMVRSTSQVHNRRFLASLTGLRRLTLGLVVLLLFTACSSPNTAKAPDQQASQQEQQDAPIWDPNDVTLTRQQLGPGVYAVIPARASEQVPAGIPAATTGGFVVGDRGVLAIESMINERLADQMLGLIREVTNKPIRYVVNTSYHGDHSYGNHYFPAATQVIQHEATADYIATNFEEDVAFMSKHFANRGLSTIEPRPADILVPDGEDLTIDLGGETVEIRQFGFAQTPGDLFVWIPSAQTMWTGNALIADAPAIPWLLDGGHVKSLASMRRVRSFLPADAKVVPGHGAVTDVQGVQEHIDYLAALDAEIRRAVAEGMTLEDAQRQVHVDAYRDYAIYGWVHSQLNVPQAYTARAKAAAEAKK